MGGTSWSAESGWREAVDVCLQRHPGGQIVEHQPLPRQDLPCRRPALCATASSGIRLEQRCRDRRPRRISRHGGPHPTIPKRHVASLFQPGRKRGRRRSAAGGGGAEHIGHGACGPMGPISESMMVQGAGQTVAHAHVHVIPTQDANRVRYT